MGLVVQAPADALLAMLAPAVNGQAGAPVAPAGGFEAMLQALLGGATGPKEKAADTLLALLPGALRKDHDGDADDGSALSGAGALAAALAAIQALMAPAAAPTDAPETASSASTLAGPASALPSGPPVAAEASAVATAASGAPAAAPDEDSSPATDVAPLDRPQPDVAAAVPAPPTEASAPASPLNTADVLAQVESLLAAAPGDARHDIHARRDPGGDEPDATPKPPAVESVAPDASVVRSAGNAQNTNNNADTADTGKHGTAEKPRPNASVEGIAHAAPNSAVGQLRDDTASPTTAATKPGAIPEPAPPAVQHVTQTVLEQVEKGGGEARIHLHPAELGDVVIHVRTDGDHVRVEIHADNAEAMNLLRDHTADLSQLLGSRGLNLGDVYVGLGANGGGNANQGGENAGTPSQRANGQFAALMGINEPAPVEQHNRLRAIYNPDGALGYRV